MAFFLSLVASKSAALTRTIFASLFLTVIACLAIPSPGGEVNDWDRPIIVQGQYDDGRVAETIVERSTEGSFQRATFIDRALTLEKPLSTLTGGLWTILILTLMGLIFAGMALRRLRRLDSESAAVFSLISVSLILLWAFNLPENAHGEAAIRAYISTFTETDNVVSFTVPESGWTYVIVGGFPFAALYLTLAISVLALLMRRGGSMSASGLQIVWVMIALGCVLYQAVTVGGLPWRPQDGALFLTAPMLVSAIKEDDNALCSCRP